MAEKDLDRRLSLGAILRARRMDVATAATEEFLRRHPDWNERYGKRARTSGVEDGAFHVDFLAGAVESGSREAFEEYARWTSRMLAARGISAVQSAEFLLIVAQESVRDLPAPDRAAIDALAASGNAACLGPAPTAAIFTGALALTREVFTQSLRAGQRMAALNVLTEALHQGQSIPDLYADVLQESLYEIGRLWESAKISVAEEHLATAIVQFSIAQLYPRIPRASTPRGRMVVAGVQGELHQVGSQMVADFLESDGWDVRFLGTHMPHEGILSALESHKADALGLSATMLFNVAPLARLVRAARERFPARRLLIVVGGGAFRNAPDLWREAGADGWASDLREAQTMMRRLAAG